MSSIDSTTLRAKLNALNNGLSYISPEVESVLSIALSSQIMDPKNVITVISIDTLPNLSLYTSPAGIICFITDIDIFAISTSDRRWLTLDGRLLRQDTTYGELWGWGRWNGTSELNILSPVVISESATTWCQVSAGGGATLAVKTNGTLWGWGADSEGALGNNTRNGSICTPILVGGGFTDWSKVCIKGSSAVGLRSNGTLWTWGCNITGQLGDGTVVCRSSPVSVVGGFTDWCHASMGTNHIAAIRSNGTLWSWGNNSCGQLGDGTVINASSPVSVVGGFTDWCTVSVGLYHNLAIRSNCTLWAWGIERCAVLGIGSTNLNYGRSSPVCVTATGGNWCQVSAGHHISFGIKNDGTAWSWGTALCGGLGNNQASLLRCFPGLICGGFTDWCCIDVSHHLGQTYNSVLGIRANGTLWGWGCNTCGEVGDGTTINRSSPVLVSGGFTDWCTISSSGGNFNPSKAGIRNLC
jgi:alpha-tubulin suppressor-like RCC1 family protein